LKDYYIIDSHCDTLGKILDNGINAFNDGQCHISIDGLKTGRVGLQFFAAWVGPKYKYYPCLQRGLKLIDAYYTMLEYYPDTFFPLLCKDDIEKLNTENKIGALLAVEGGDILEGEISNLRILYHLGVRAITLTWNYRNELADGVLESKSMSGLSSFGCEVVKEMNRLGILVDVSHLSEKGFYDVMETSTKPIAATHSNAWSIHPHPRNLKDEQIMLLAKNKGVMGINFYPPFLTDQKADLSHIIRHIDYVAGLAGTDVLGFGSDFDGIEETPENVNGPEVYNSIIETLLKLNYKEDDIKKIAYGNYKRLLYSVL